MPSSMALLWSPSLSGCAAIATQRLRQRPDGEAQTKAPP